MEKRAAGRRSGGESYLWGTGLVWVLAPGHAPAPHCYDTHVELRHPLFLKVLAETRCDRHPPPQDAQLQTALPAAHHAATYLRNLHTDC